MRKIALLAALSALPLGGCASHISPYRAKERAIEPGEYPKPLASRGGSLYAAGSHGLFEDDRAGQVGDVLVIQIDETNSASQDGTTKLDGEHDASAAATGGLASLLAKAIPGGAAAQALGATQQNNFAGSGQIVRHGSVTAMLPVRVRRILPNGDLYVEGTKVVMVGDEEHHLYISGIVRPVDIRNDGSVSSSRLADAEIEYSGRGDISDKQSPGWLSRVLGKVWPF